MVLLETTFQATQNTNGVFDRRLGHVDLLEAPGQGTVFLEDAAKFLESGRANATDIARGQQRLEQIRSVHDTAGSGTRADDGVDFVNEQDRLWTFFQLAEQRLEAFLEVAAIFGAGQQGTQVERIDDAAGQQIRHLVVDDALGQAFGDRGLANARLSHQQRVVLAPTSEDLRDTLDLQLAADQWIDTPLACQLIEVAGIRVQGIA